MALAYVLNQAGAKMGLNPSQPSDRLVLLRFANEAAEELYDSFDPEGCMLEEAFKVNGDQTISMPMYVGEVRGVRECASWISWHINQMRPRYNQFNWVDSWRNIRLKNIQALAATVTNTSVGVITVTEIENPPIVVTVSGSTETARNIGESITMDALSKQTTNQYNDYNLIAKDRVNNCNVTLSDVDGKLLSIIPNDCLEASYQIYDVSVCPFLNQNTSQQSNYLEILFKKTLPWFQNDSDQFPAQKYDNIWVNKILQLWKEEQDDAQGALMYDGKATRSAARKKVNRNESTEEKVAVVANPHDTLLPRIRGGRRSRGWWKGGWIQ
jgi:hypothetical protein